MIQIKKTILIMLIMFTCSMAVFAKESYNDGMNSTKLAEEKSYTLQAGVSIIEKVPNSFYGTWRVAAKLSSTTNSAKFKPTSIDLWNLSREGNVINLSNPFTGANASITVSYVGDDIIKFSKIGNYDGMRLTDTVEIRLKGDTFSGINKLSLETLSDVNNSVVNTETAAYNLRGERISGDNIINK